MGIVARGECSSEGHSDMMQPAVEQRETVVNNKDRSVAGPAGWLREHMKEVRCRMDFWDLPNIEAAELGDNWAVGSCFHDGLECRIQRLTDLDRSYDFHLLNLGDQCRVLDLLSHVPIFCHPVLGRSC